MNLPLPPPEGDNGTMEEDPPSQSNFAKASLDQEASEDETGEAENLEKRVGRSFI